MISKAFILGAGLGTRLRPLTNTLPKPLVPVWNAPLISYAFDHLINDLETSEFIVNTHHAAEKYLELFPEKTYRENTIEFRHEEVLLDTAGGLDNIRGLLPKDESILVYNGDILTDLPLRSAAKTHFESGNLATLILRSSGQNPNVGFDPETGKVTDMRNELATNSPNPVQFTGIYFVAPEFLSYIKPGKIESVVFPLLEAIQKENRIGGVVVDNGHWSDLGDIPSYLGALDTLQSGFPSFGLHPNKCRIHSTATVADSAAVDSLSTVGAGAVIGEGADIIRSVVWPGAIVQSGQQITGEVILPREISPGPR
ncbi:MAG: sugar phosphate nucleotidyltransferase [Verrucomicrobiales bacterium]|nr:sugar phosphate nucleotidyltransferase [Verrucomicrobiales bacterium]